MDEDAPTDAIGTEVDAPDSGLFDRVVPEDFPPAIPERYQRGPVLGTGGMGTVWGCRDADLDREIALKTLSFDPKARPDLLRRFVREARIQARLDHPAIVPVHELRAGPVGPYFTMKRVRGLTLAHVLGRQAAGDADYRRRYGMHRLVTAFGRVCEAIDYAHTQGVIHRDLKPANIMIADFGAVYLIDWGIAKVLGDTSSGDELREPLGSPTPLPADDLTRPGTHMGTGGYIPPELGHGRAREADAQSDIYALGVILFEILTAARLPPLLESYGSVGAALEAAAPDAPPELAAICVRATKLERKERHPSARALVEDVNRFLEGDRDLVRRQVVSREHSDRASAALTSGAASHEQGLREAWRDIGRALALDPDNNGALQTLVSLLDHVPKDVPPEVEAEVDRRARLSVKNAGRVAGFLYLVLMGGLFSAMTLGVLDWRPVLLALSFTAVAAGVTFTVSPARLEGRSPLFYPGFMTSTVAIGLLGSIFGPLILVPGLLAVNTMGHVFTWYRGRTYQAYLISSMAIVIPFALQWLGWVPDSLVLGPRGLEIHSWAYDIAHPGAIPQLLLACLLTLGGGLIAATQVRRNLDEMVRRDQLRAWQLKQMLPLRRAKEHPRAGTKVE